MRFFALAFLVTACVAPKPAPPSVPVPPNTGRYAIPDRYNLPGNNKEAPETYEPELLTVRGERMVELVKDPKEPLRDQAVLVLVARLSQTERGPKTPYSWIPVANALEALDVLFAEERPDAFRRWAVYDLFSFASSEVRGRITLDAKDTETDRWWARCEELRARGRRDKDPVLAEFFERYEEDPEAARWRETKAAAVASREKLLKAHPEMKELLAKVWALQASIEDAQLTVLSRLKKNIDSQKGVPAARRERLKAVETSWVNHRLRIVWANMLPRIVADALDPAEAKAYGFVPAPVRTGWPVIPVRQ